MVYLMSVSEPSDVYDIFRAFSLILYKARQTYKETIEDIYELAAQYSGREEWVVDINSTLA